MPDSGNSIGTVFIEVRLDDKVFKGELSQLKINVEKEAKDLGSKLDKNLGSAVLGPTSKMWVGWAATAIGAILSVDKIVGSMKYGAYLQQLHVSFKNMAASIGADSNILLKTMEKNSKRMLDNASMMEQSIEGINLGLSEEQISGLTDIATVISKATAKPIEQVYKSISTASATGYAMVLRQLHLFTQEEIRLLYKAGRENIGVSVYDILEAKAQDLRKTTDMTTLDSQQRLDQLSVAWGNFKDTVSIGASTIGLELFGLAKDIYDAISDAFTKINDAAKMAWNYIKKEFIEPFEAKIKPLTDKITKMFEALTPDWAKKLSAWLTKTGQLPPELGLEGTTPPVPSSGTKPGPAVPGSTSASKKKFDLIKERTSQEWKSEIEKEAMTESINQARYTKLGLEIEAAYKKGTVAQKEFTSQSLDNTLKATDSTIASLEKQKGMYEDRLKNIQEWAKQSKSNAEQTMAQEAEETTLRAQIANKEAEIEKQKISRQGIIIQNTMKMTDMDRALAEAKRQGTLKALQTEIDLETEYNQLLVDTGALSLVDQTKTQIQGRRDILNAQIEINEKKKEEGGLADDVKQSLQDEINLYKRILEILGKYIEPEQLAASTKQQDIAINELKLSTLEYQKNLAALNGDMETANKLEVQMIALRTKNAKLTDKITADMDPADVAAYTKAMDNLSAAETERAKNMNSTYGRLKNAMQDYVSSSGQGFQELSGMVNQAFQGMEDALTQFCLTGKMEYKELINSMIADLIRYIIKMQVVMPIATALNSMLGGFIGNLFGGGYAPVGSLSGIDTVYGAASSDVTGWAGHPHSGGRIGVDSFPISSVPSSLFSNAPRLHKGLQSDEYPAILQKGETVLKKGESSTQQPNIKVQIINESGQKMQATNSDVQFNFQEAVVTVWIDAMNRNAYGLRTSMGG